MITKIAWKTGEGNIIAEYSGKNSDKITLTSDVINEGLDREQIIQVKSDTSVVSVVVKQLGLREIFTTLDGEFYVEGVTFNVLKNGL